VELAAWLGHEGARIAVGAAGRDFSAPAGSTPAIGPLADVELPIGWLKKAADVDPHVEFRAAVASLHAAVAKGAPPAGLAEVCQGIHPMSLAEKWLDCPCDRHSSAAIDLSEKLYQLSDKLYDAETDALDDSRLIKCMAMLLSICADADTEEPMEMGDSPEEKLLKALVGDGSPLSFMIQQVMSGTMMAAAERGVFPNEVMDAIREELVPWLLGYSDPVRERLDSE
jgi:hypothetical protein